MEPLGARVSTLEHVSATPEELKSRIEAGIPGAVAMVTGDGHHFNAVVTASAFAGMPRLAQHRLVHDIFGRELGDRIHALSIQTRPSNPEEIR
jgi:stress-induced morphogen